MKLPRTLAGGRVRTSTVALMVSFFAVLSVWVMVRPVPVEVTEEVSYDNGVVTVRRTTKTDERRTEPIPTPAPTPAPTSKPTPTPKPASGKPAPAGQTPTATPKPSGVGGLFAPTPTPTPIPTPTPTPGTPFEGTPTQ